ncbi:GNAT family N-acetyltransferase [Bacillus alkalicellulosilyticus]|uniref:GNAT family N-acetyltransferase n=1 Tax=Alkalihalobacterium alkalicellulosilyticum TaxID=1912214 RepID=UPI000997D2AC|nr:GNAT family N-acetyltransferase [Bacillus alkalicellulosilyticus]
MEWTVKTFEELTNVELYNIIKERITIFIVEQNCPYPELDDLDKVSYHLFAKESNEEIIAYSRILPKDTLYPYCSIGRVIVKKEYRKAKLGRELLTRGLTFIDEHFHDKMVKIMAQHYLLQFYQSFGFEPVSDVFLEDGIPHIDMMLNVSDWRERCTTK